MLDVRSDFRGAKEDRNIFVGIDSRAAALAAANDGMESLPHGDTRSDTVVRRRWWCDYSHVLIIDDQTPGNPFPDHLRLVHEGSYFSLYRSIMFESETKG